MRVLHVIDNLNAGGAQTFVIQLAVEQSKLNNHVTICIIDKLAYSAFEQNLISKANEHLVKVISTNRRLGKNISFIKSIFRIIKEIKRGKPDIINSHLPLSHLTVSISLKVYSALYKKVQHVVTLHNAPEIWNTAVLWLNKKKPSVYCSIASLNSSLKRNSNNIVIENGIEAPAVNCSAEEMLKKLNLDKATKLVLCVGKLSTQKNFNLVFQIANCLKGEQIAFLISGLPGNTSIQDQANFEKASNIYYLGVCLPEVIHSLMYKCDCFLNTSLYEGLPITVLEAFLIGVPTVISPIAAHYEIGSLMPYCYIPSSFSPDAFINKIQLALSFNNEKENIQRDRKEYLWKFQINNTAKNYIQFYQSLL